MSNTFFQSPELFAEKNKEYKTKQKLNGKWIYFKYIYYDSLRISNSGTNILQNVNDIHEFCIKFQGVTGGSEINFLPYVHTDNAKVYINMSGTNLRIITNGNYAGNYRFWGWVKYTKVDNS